MHENTRLRIEAAGNKMQQDSIEAIRDEANKRIEEYRSREKILAAQIQQNADERITRAQAEQHNAEERIGYFLKRKTFKLQQ
jgi:hypothetical protein